MLAGTVGASDERNDRDGPARRRPDDPGRIRRSRCRWRAPLPSWCGRRNSSVGPAAAANRLAGRVVSTSYLGGSAVYEIDIGGKKVVRANTQIDGRLVREGEAVNIGFDPAGCVLLDEKGIRIS